MKMNQTGSYEFKRIEFLIYNHDNIVYTDSLVLIEDVKNFYLIENYIFVIKLNVSFQFSNSQLSYIYVSMNKLNQGVELNLWISKGNDTYTKAKIENNDKNDRILVINSLI